MKIDLIELCDGLEYAIRDGESLAFVLGYVLGDDFPIPEDNLTDLEFVRAVRRTASQASLTAQTRLQNTRTEHSQNSRTLAAERPLPPTVRTTVSTADQNTHRTPAEQRALELLREGYSVRKLLEQLKAEGLRLDRNKLKGLRAEL